MITNFGENLRSVIAENGIVHNEIDDGIVKDEWLICYSMTGSSFNNKEVEHAGSQVKYTSSEQ